jgi:ABC-type branched-subunit amino acid transport system substrate-binding protein
MRRSVYGYFAAAAVIALVAAGCGSSKSSSSPSTTTGSTATTGGATTATTASGSAPLTASAPGITKTTITLGYITSATGVASSTFADGPAAAQARIALQNAQGGIDGRKIVLVPVDDQSSPTQDLTAAQDLVQTKGVFGIIDFSPFTFGGTKYLSQHGVPVTGFGFDGPEWAQSQSTNMFSWSPLVDTPIGGSQYGYTTDAVVLKALGVTKLGGLGYGISNSSQTSIKAILTAAASLGITKCYENQSVPFGGVDFTAAVLAIKAAGCDGIAGSFVDSSDIALSGAIKNAGLTNIKQMYFTGYDSQILDNPSAASSFAGSYVGVSYDPNSSNAASQAMFSALKQYDTSYKAGSIPDLGLYGSYISADLMIYGLQKAGPNPTRATFISTMRQVGTYNAGGLLPTAIPFTNFGTPAMLPAQSCAQFAYISGGKFVYYDNGKLVCGSLIKINPNI